MRHDILVVEDEADIRALMAGILTDEGYGVREAATSQAAHEQVKARIPSLIILDVWLKDSEQDGIQFLSAFKAAHPDVPVIVVSGHGTVETAVSAIRKGAYDYIVKPFKAAKLLVTVERAVEASSLRKENAELRGRAPSDSELIGASPGINQLPKRLFVAVC